MQCTGPIRLDVRKTSVIVPCQRCRACRIRRASEWTMRLTHESTNFDGKGIFVTLTYSDEALKKLDSKLRREKGIDSVYKRDLQSFFKMLRKDLDREKIKIKYYACGEYGEEKQRPHYHAIILGLSYSNLLDHKRIADNWHYGNTHFGTVTAQSMRYVADYVQKRFYNPNEDEVNKYYNGRNPEFQLQSIGIGKSFVEKNREKIERDGFIYYKGVKHGLPRYYKNKVNISQEAKDKLSINRINKEIDKYHFPFGTAIDECHPLKTDMLKQKEKTLKAQSDMMRHKKL